MSEATLDSENAVSKFIGDIRELWRVHRYIRVTWKIGKARSWKQNKHSHVWYEQVAQELREDTAGGVKAFCKLHFGVPILIAEDAEFRELYNSKIKMNFSYEQKLIIMETCDFPVTRLMSKDQTHRYEARIQEHFRAKGVTLEYLEKAA